MQPLKRSLMMLFSSSGDIQLPSSDLTPGFAKGTASLRSGVAMKVLDSTLATSLGSVRANQLLSHSYLV